MKRQSSSGSGAATVGLVSLGCAKNQVDSQILTGFLLSEGLRLASPAEYVDILLVNTCSFIRDARRESEREIRRACTLKKKGMCRAVVVAGCLAQRYGVALRKLFPDVDAFLGVDQLDRIGAICKGVLEGARGIVEVFDREPRRVFENPVPRVVLSRGPFAYLKIAEGCSHHCSFCIIPRIGGKYRSRDPDRIVQEAEWLLARGFRELNLVAQDSTAYGSDRDDGISLPLLLRHLGGLGGKFWIRILYGYPSRITDDLLETMAEVRQVCHYLDVPIQHSHPDLLRAMGRADTLDDIGRFVTRARAVLPDVALRTTCLVGFPGEGEKHFEHLVRFLQEMRFDHVGVFAFSPEEGTPAFDMPSRPTMREIRRRREHLLAVQSSIAKQNMRGRIGEECEVLLERPASDEPGVWLARSRGLAPEVDGVIRVHGANAHRKAGDFVWVKVSGLIGHDMHAVETAPYCAA